MEAILKLEKKDGTILHTSISEIKSMKLLKEELKHIEYIRLKETILLNQFKYSVKEYKEDPLGDLKIFRKEVTRYFKVKGVPIIEDSVSEGDFSIYVETDMFGGTHKHLSKREYQLFV